MAKYSRNSWVNGMKKGYRSGILKGFSLGRRRKGKTKGKKGKGIRKSV